MLYVVLNSHDSTITFMLLGAFLIVQLMPISPPLSFFGKYNQSHCKEELENRPLSSSYKRQQYSILLHVLKEKGFNS